MKKTLITLTAAGLLASSLVFADSPQPFNLVTYPVVVKSWVKTQTAKVTIGMNANVTDQALAELHQRVMTNLDKIAKAQWHITQFNRRQDSSGLENVTIQAVARLQSKQLAQLKNNAKAISKPGETYKLANIQFMPTLAEMEKAKMALRMDVYEKVKAEVAGLNKLYSKADYHVYSINFIPGQMSGARPMNTTMFVRGVGGATPLVVSHQVMLAAVVKLHNDVADTHKS